MIKRLKGIPRPHKVAISVLSVLIGLLSLAPSESAVAGRDQPEAINSQRLAEKNIGERQPLALAINIEEAPAATFNL